MAQNVTTNASDAAGNVTAAANQTASRTRTKRFFRIETLLVTN